MQILSSFAVLAAIALGVAQAKPSPTVDLHARGGSKSSGSDDCGKDEFFYLIRSCCLSHGGPTTKPSPPSGVSCPSSKF